MAGTVKGITIEFKGETTNLQKALKDVRGEARDFDKELGYINTSLKFNPGDVTLTSQKMTVLKQAAEKSKEHAEELKKALQQMKDNGVDETSEEYRELEREIIRAESKQKAYNTELNKLNPSKVEKVATKLRGIGDALTTAGQKLMPLSAAGAAVDTALAGMAIKSGKAADELKTLSSQTGISTTDLQKYGAAADLVDVSVEMMAKSQVKMKKAMSQASKGSKKQAEAFDTLGVSVTDANGELRDQSEVFDEVIKALGEMENPVERDALAMDIFGKSAAELNPLIEDGGRTYQKVAEIYDKTGLNIVDQETLDKAQEFNDAIDTIKLTGQAALSQIGSKLAGYLAPALEKVVGWVQKIAEWLGKLSPETLTMIGIIAGIVAALGPALIIIGKVATGISSIMTLSTTLGPTLAGLAGPIGIVIAILGALVAAGILVYKNWDKIKETVTKVVAHVQAKWILLKRDVTSVFNSIKTTVTNVWTTIKTFVTTTVDKIKAAALLSWTAFKVGLKTIIDAIKTFVTTAWDNIKTKVTTTVDGIKTAVSTAWDNIKTKVTTVVDGIKTAISTKWDAIKTKITTVADSIKSAVKDKFDTIKYNITHPIETAKEKVKAIVDKIKEIIGGVKLQLPKFKLPHLSVSAGEAPWGIGGKGKLPSFNVDWYKEGGIFTKPTLLAGVGEAGPEAVLPIEKLKDWMQPNGITINVYGSDNMSVNELAAAVERRLVNSVKRKQYAWG